MLTIVRSPELGQVLDVLLASSAILILVFYHVWYYSWRFTNLVEGRGYHRVDITGQRARVGCNVLQFAVPLRPLNLKQETVLM
jgi:hypothetical protein